MTSPCWRALGAPASSALRVAGFWCWGAPGWPRQPGARPKSGIFRALDVANAPLTGLLRPRILRVVRLDCLSFKEALFSHLIGRWRDLFNVSFDVLLYDLTSTYVESDPPLVADDKRQHGYSRDHRPDCVQIVIALVVTPEGLPLTYEVLPGNTADSTTLHAAGSAVPLPRRLKDVSEQMKRVVPLVEEDLTFFQTVISACDGGPPDHPSP